MWICNRPRSWSVEDHRTTRTFLADNLSPTATRSPPPTRWRGPRLLELDAPDSRSSTSACRTARARVAGARARGGPHAGRLDPDAAAARPVRAGERDRPIRGFDRGADDYIVKPFRIRSCGAASRRCCAAPRARARRRRCGSASSRSTRVSRDVRVGGRARGALPEGVRAAAGARGPADRGSSRRRSCSGRLGLQVDGPYADLGLARLPAAPQARRRGRALRGQRVGRRVPAGRRARGGG